MEHLPFCAIPLNVLWIWIHLFLHTHKGKLSTKLIPNIAKENLLDE